MTMRRGKSVQLLAGMPVLSRVLLLLGLCSAATAAYSQTNVRINFDAAGCPQAGVQDVTVGRGKPITWQAYRDNQPAAVPFEIYFDPLNGQPHRGRQGTVRAVISDRSPANVTYKYTIVGDNCPNSPLDPNIFVN